MIGFLVFLLFVLVVIALIRISVLHSRIEELRFDLRMLSGRVGVRDDQPMGKETSHPPATVAPAANAPAPSPLPPAAPRPAPIVQQAPPPPSAPPKPSRTREEWEALIGGKLLNRIGALALIIGMSFFLKHAFEQNWITEWMRVLIGVVTGAALLAGAARSRKGGLVIFSQGLVGAGIAVLYLSVYASFNFYHLVSQLVAFGCMGVVTVLTFLLAFRYNSLAVSLLGWLGGFLTPFLLSTGQANVVGLFTYIALLDAGVLAVLLMKDQWSVLEPLTLVGTYLIFYLWYFDDYGSPYFAATVFFLSVFWLLFHALDTARSATTPGAPSPLHKIVAGTSISLFFVALYLVVNKAHHPWMGGTTCALAAVYAASAVFISRRQQHTAAVMQNAIVAMVLFVLAAAIQFEHFMTIAVYAAQAAFLAWMGSRWNLRYVSNGALVVLYWGAQALLGTSGALVTDDPGMFRVLLNPRASAFLALTAASAIMLLIDRGREGRNVPAIRGALHLTWSSLLFLLCTVEISDYYRAIMAMGDGLSHQTIVFHRTLTHVALWTFYAIPLVWVGYTRKVRTLLYAGIAIAHIAGLAAVIGCSTYSPWEEFTPVVNLRMGLFLFTAGVLAWMAFRYSRTGEKPLGEWMHIGWILLLFDLCLAEVLDYYRMAMAVPGAATELLTFQRLLVLAAVWSVFAIPLSWVGIRRGIRVVAGAGVIIALFGAIVAGLRGIAFDPPEAFIPLLNIRAGVIVVMLLLLVAQHRLLLSGEVYALWKPTLAATIRYFIVVCMLILLTGEIRDYYERELALMETGDSALALQLENLKQMFLSCGWLVYSIGLMAIGLWRRMRWLRFFAIGLFAVAILKIFIYDLASLETLYRIFSFIGLGVILLAVSYLYQRYRDLILK